jgi:hypothetical protein
VASPRAWPYFKTCPTWKCNFSTKINKLYSQLRWYNEMSSVLWTQLDILWLTLTPKAWQMLVGWLIDQSVDGNQASNLGKYLRKLKKWQEFHKELFFQLLLVEFPSCTFIYLFIYLWKLGYCKHHKICHPGTKFTKSRSPNLTFFWVKYIIKSFNLQWWEKLLNI